MPNYLCVQRSLPDGGEEKPSPAQMQDMYAQFTAWQEQFKDKPPQAITKIVEGKLNNFFQTVCLVDQGFVKDPEKTVQAYVEETSKKLGDKLVIRRFVRFQVGEAATD